MKKILFGLILTCSLSFAVAAQKNGQTGQIQANTSLEAQLQQNLDVKNAKVGDEVILKVSKTIKQNGETVVPKGANIIGRITEVKQKSKDNASSKLGIVFDRLQNKNLDAPINVSIVSITQAAANVSGGSDNSDAEILGNSSSSGSVSSGNSGGNSGGGLLGGVGKTVGGVTNRTTQTVGGVTQTAGQTVGGVTKTVGRSINGIQISQSANASVNGSTTLSSNDKNLKLEKGVTFNLLLTEAAGN